MLKRCACPLTQFRQVKTPSSPHGLPITHCKGVAPFPQEVSVLTPAQTFQWSIWGRALQVTCNMKLLCEKWNENFAPYGFVLNGKSNSSYFCDWQILKFSGFLQPSSLFLFWQCLITHEPQLRFPWRESLNDLAQTFTKFLRTYSIWRPHPNIISSCNWPTGSKVTMGGATKRIVTGILCP